MRESLIREDRDRGFADWGVTVGLRRVSQYAGEADGDGRIEPYLSADVTFVDAEPEESYRFVTVERSPEPDSVVTRERQTAW